MSLAGYFTEESKNIQLEGSCAVWRCKSLTMNLIHDYLKKLIGFTQCRGFTVLSFKSLRSGFFSILLY